MRIDDSLKIATALLAGHMETTAVPTAKVMRLLHEWHRSIMRMQSGTYTAWVDELPAMDLLDQAAADAAAAEAPAAPAYVEPKIYPPPLHPLAAPEVSVEDKVAGTVHTDAIECLECGKSVKLMKSHLLTSHNKMTWGEYLDRHGLAEDYPATTQAHRDRQRADQQRIKGVTPGDADQKKYEPVSADFGRRRAQVTDDRDGDGELGKTG